MMTKYQLVFIKLETSLYKFDHLIATRETLLKSEAFYSILNFIKFNNLALIYKKRLVANRLKKTLTNKLFSPLDFFIKKTIANGFYKIFEYSKVFSNQRKFNEELNFIKEENALTLKKRDQDLKILAKKSEELSNEINSLKHRENEYSSKIKLQDQMINSLQQDPHLVHSNDQLPQNSLLAKKNIPLNEGNTKVKALEQKVYYFSLKNAF